MQWRWPIPLSALIVLIVVTPLEAQAPEAGAGATLPVEALHLVQKLDNLHLLAAYYYGDARQWVRILDANRGAIQDPSVIHPGQILHLRLSPDWTPPEPYEQWKTRVGGVVPPPMPSPAAAPEQTSSLPK